MIRKFNNSELENVSGGGYSGTVVLHHKNDGSTDNVSIVELAGKRDEDMKTLRYIDQVAKAGGGRITGYVESDNSKKGRSYQFGDNLQSNVNLLLTAADEGNTPY